MQRAALSRRITLVSVVLLAITVPALVVTAQSAKAKTVKRAQPPKFDRAKTSGTFFDDVFTKLQGERPAFAGSGRPSPAGGSATPAVAPAASGGAPATSGSGWSALVSASTLQDEVKAVKQKLDLEVSAPGPFAAKGFNACRKHFSILAMLFGIMAEYEGDLKWKAPAPGLRDVMAKTAGNCKVGTIQVFNEAKARKQELEDLLGGGAVNAKAENVAGWDAIAGRVPLMKRLDECMGGKLQPMTANKGEFNSNLAQVQHEAEMMAAIAQVLQKEGMVDAADTQYTGFAERMKKAARDLIQACQSKDDAKATAAVGEMSKACSSCHEGYR